MTAVSGGAGSSAERYLVDAFDIAGATVTAALMVTATLRVGGPIGVLLALAFVTFVPGWAFLDWVPVGEGTSRVALAVAVSLTVCTAAAQSLLWLGLWSPLGLLYTVGPLSLVALVAHVVTAGTITRAWADR